MIAFCAWFIILSDPLNFLKNLSIRDIFNLLKEQFFISFGTVIRLSQDLHSIDQTAAGLPGSPGRQGCENSFLYSSYTHSLYRL